jgi:hypothetical protein
MERFLRVTALGAVAVLATALCMDTADPSWNVPLELSNELARGQYLDEAMASNGRARDERYRIAAEVEAGTLSLDEAIELSRPLNADDRVSWNFLRGRYPDATVDELVGYQLVVAAYARPRKLRAKDPAFLRTLATMLQERFGDGVVLPKHLEELRDE